MQSTVEITHLFKGNHVAILCLNERYIVFSDFVCVYITFAKAHAHHTARVSTAPTTHAMGNA